MALSALVRAGVAAGAGDVPTVAAMTEEGQRYSKEIAYEALQPPSVVFEAWVAEQRDDREAAADAYRRALEVSSRAGFRDHASFALTGLGSVALADGDLKTAEELLRRALGAALYDPMGWLVVHARVQFARVLAAAGEVETAGGATLPERRRVVGAEAVAPGSRDALSRPCRQPGRDGSGRSRRDRRRSGRARPRGRPPPARFDSRGARRCAARARGWASRGALAAGGSIDSGSQGAVRGSGLAVRRDNLAP